MTPLKLPRSRGSQLYLVLLLGVAAGMVLIALDAWRIGVSLVGITFIIGAVARAVVPPDHIGMLRVRGTPFDVVWMTLLGVSLVVLAVVIPNQPG
ncbi:MAG: DUF3017 domain-containing protein [Aeromicrobium sp.]|uniref:DUF3017 domain-containing protein n=1 Tax=Aeromicrobium sp. TaxID=1871063 RepID=UPI003C6894F3